MVCSKIAANELTHRGAGVKTWTSCNNSKATTHETAAPRMKVSHCRSITATCVCTGACLPWEEGEGGGGGGFWMRKRRKRRRKSTGESLTGRQWRYITVLSEGVTKVNFSTVWDDGMILALSPHHNAFHLRSNKNKSSII